MSLGVSLSQLVQMRADVAQLLPGTAILNTRTQTTDGAGGFTTGTVAVTGGTVACRFDPANSKSQLFEIAKAGVFAFEYVVTLPWDAPVALGQVVAYANKFYEITSLTDEHSWRVSRRATASRVE